MPGIEKNQAFEEKGLAEYSANVGRKCGNECVYCYATVLNCRKGAHKKLGKKLHDPDYAIVDPKAHEAIARDAAGIPLEKRGIVELATVSDAWSPEAHDLRLGKECLEAILKNDGWTVRILTKGSGVQDDFDLCKQYRDRVLVGMSIGATPDKDDIIKVIEPNAPKISERMEIMREAHRRGLRTYAMFCPLLPGIADSPEQIEKLVTFANEIDAEAIFSESINDRGGCMKRTADVLEQAGKSKEAATLRAMIGKNGRKAWSRYTTDLVTNITQVMEKVFKSTDKLRFLLYPANLTDTDLRTIKKLDTGFIRWLGGLKILRRKSTDKTKPSATVSFEKERFTITHAPLDAEGKNRDAVSQEIRNQITQKLPGPSKKEVKSAVNAYLEKLAEAAGKPKAKKAAKSSSATSEDDHGQLKQIRIVPRDSSKAGKQVANITYGAETITIEHPSLDTADESNEGLVRIFAEVMKKWPNITGEAVEAAILEYIQKQIDLSNDPEERLKALPAKARTAAKKMLKNPNLMQELAQDLEAIGIVGESEVAQVLYLTGTSRMLDRPLACIVMGSSSSGKSCIIRRVAELFPEECVLKAHGITPQGLINLPEGFLQHRFIVAGERSQQQGNQSADATRSLRELLADGEISRLTHTQHLKQQGPIAYVESTSLEWDDIFQEDRNRCLPLKTDESEEQTKRIIQSYAAGCVSGTDEEKIVGIYEKHYAIQWMLTGDEVRIPFAGRLAASFPTGNLEMRRLFPMLSAMIKTVALLHQHQRRKASKGKDAIQAERQDYEIARQLLSHPFKFLGLGLQGATREFYEDLKKAFTGATFRISDIQKKPILSDRATISGHIKDLRSMRLVETVPSAGGKGVTYQLAANPPDDMTLAGLPDPATIFAADGSVHPAPVSAGNSVLPIRPDAISPDGTAIEANQENKVA